MKKFIWIKYVVLIAVLNAVSCRSITRNIDKEKTSKEEISQSETSLQKETETTKESKTNTSSQFDLTQFSITPIDGFAEFQFNYGGQLITGKTSGVINFSNEKKAENKQEEKKETTVTKINYKTKTYYKTIVKTYNHHKAVTKTVVYTWWFWVLLILGTVIGWELLKKLWKTVKKSQWWLNIINALMRMR